MDFEKIKKALTEKAAKAGVTEFEIYYMSSSDISVETLKDEISTYSSGVSGGICFRCRVNGKMGYASTEETTPEAVVKLVGRALENAEFTDKDDAAPIFAGSDKYLQTNAPKYVPVSPEKLTETALAIQRSIYSQSDMVTDGTQSYTGTSGICVRIYNSHGLDLSNNTGVNLSYAYAVLNNGEESREGYELASLDDKEFSPESLAKQATETALGNFGSGKVTTGKYNIVIDGKQMKTILSAFSPAFSAKSAQMGLSLFAGKEGQKVASDAVTITDDPMRPGIAIQTPFDAEGVATYRKNIIEKGVLKTLLHNLETSAKAGVPDTANASKGGYSSPVGISPYAFCIEAGDKTRDELFAIAENGLFITEVKGLHAGADATTGDFSIECSGFRIENGRKGQAVRSFTIAGNFFDLLKQTAALSDKVDTGIPTGFTVFGSPDLFVRDMSVAGS